MKRFFNLLFIGVTITFMTACGNGWGGEAPAADAGSQEEADSQVEAGQALEEEMVLEETNEKDTEILQASQAGADETGEEEENHMTMNIQIGEHLLTATLVENSSTEALIGMLSEGPVTVEMNDYAGMEKVGTLPESLPRNDEQINTGAGDLILYQGNSFVIYYGTNSWSLTRLGKIDGVTQQELMDILGEGSVTAVLSMENAK